MGESSRKTDYIENNGSAQIVNARITGGLVMKLKKIISAAQAFALFALNISFVNPAAYAEESREFIINDTFDKLSDGKFDACGWEIGEANDGLSAVFPSSHWAMPNMALVSVPKGGNTALGNQAVIRKELDEPVDLTKNRVVLETVISTDTTAGLNIDFGYNRPKNIKDVPSGAFEDNLYTIFRVSASGATNGKGQNIANVQMLNPSHGLTAATNYAAASGTPAETDGKVKLAFQDSVKIKAVMDYKHELISYYITAPDGGTYTRDGWNDCGNMTVRGVCPDKIESLDISAWCANGSKYWIDDVKLYTLDPLMNEEDAADNKVDFENGYRVDKDAKTVISAEFSAKSESGELFFDYHKAGDIKQKSGSAAFEGFEENAEYSLEMTIDNINQKSAYSLCKDGKIISEKEVNGIDFSDFDIIDSIYSDSILLKSVKVYNQKSQAKATLSAKNGEYKYYLGDQMKLSFDTPIDLEKIKDYLRFSCNGEYVDVKGDYNSKSGEYTFNLDGFKSGSWKIELSDELIYNNDGSMKFSENSLGFSYVGSSKPVADNVRLNGKIKEGERIVPSFDYYQSEDVPMGECIHEWYISDTFEGEYVKIDGETQNELIVKPEMLGKYIKYSVIPVTEDGAVGERVFSENVIAPEVAPFVTNAKIEGTPAVGATLSLKYDFNDANGDKESDSQYQWYVSDSADGGFVPISGAVKKNFTVPRDFMGKFIRASVTPVSDAAPEMGETVYTASIGKIGDIIEMTNLVSNADFENGTIQGWTTFNFAAGDGISLAKSADGQPALGKYSMFVKGKTSASHTYISPSFTLKGGKTYIAGGKVYPVDGTMGKIYAKTNTLTGITLATPYVSDEASDAKVNQWTAVYTTWVADGASCPDSRLSLQSDLYTGNFYIDDVYVGELEICDIDADFENKEVTIPENGTKEITIENVKVYNQLGTGNGLADEKVSWVTEKDYPGVDIRDNKIVVSDSAVAGDINVLAVCNPTFAGHTAERFEKSFTIKLLPNSDTAPKISNLKITGAVELGETLKGSYDYYQVNGYRDLSTYQWFVSDSENGEYAQIDGACGIEYTVTEETAGKFIKLVVYPECENGIKGTEKESNIAVKRTAPEAKNVSIAGEHKAGSRLIGSYEFFDVNMDKEGTSTFRWLASNKKDGTYSPIKDATETEYVLGEEDVNKYIKFEVTPVSKEEPCIGRAYLSEAFSGPKTPEARNVKIIKNGSKLNGSYEYYHEFNISEGKSKYEWIHDGKVISNEISIIADFSGSVTFRVTPNAAEFPYDGNPAEASITLSKQSGGSSGGGGGGSLSNIVRVPETKPEIAADLVNHWASEYAQKMISKGIMQNDEKDLFNPSRTIKRSEIITLISKVAGIKATEYKGEFSDVAPEDDFSGYLQAMVDEGIISHDVRFRPNADITREELCKALYITLNNRGKLTRINDTYVSRFADREKISTWAVEYVDAILGTGLMIGTSATEFTPRGNTTKAQMAVLLTRMMDLLGE